MNFKAFQHFSKSVIQHVNNKFPIFVPSEPEHSKAVDWLSIIQATHTAKSDKFGIQSFKLCESTMGCV
jgi:hypothetical protein